MLADLFNTTQDKIDAMIQQLRFRALQLGLPFGERTMTCNSRLAQELGHWAESKGKGEQFHNAAFKAYFAEGQNLAQVEVLLNLVKKVPLSAEEAEMVITTRSYKDAVDIDWATSRELSVTAVPTFLLGDQRLIGAQPYDTLAELVEQNGIVRRADQ